MITSGSLLIEPDASRPRYFHVGADSHPNGWMVVTHGLTPQQLEKELSATGWTFFFMAGPLRMTAFGFHRDRTLCTALKRAIKAVKQQRCNCLQVESVDMHSFLGIPYITLSARPRHIQKGMVFLGPPVGIEGGISAPELRHNVVAT
jgi:hypothetical protein